MNLTESKSFLIRLNILVYGEINMGKQRESRGRKFNYTE